MSGTVVFVSFIVILSLVLVAPYLISESDAVKSKGTSLTEINSKAVCGDKLCSEITGGAPSSIDDVKRGGGGGGMASSGLVMRSQPLADYTVLVYVVGSDLESKYYLATADFKEMVQGNPNDSINVIIESGGAKAKPIEGKRDIDFRTVKHLQVTGDGLEELKDLGKLNMGEPETLRDFIIWGTESYPAEKYVLILWNHGSGINGYGIDEISRDILSLDELHDALEEAKQTTDVNFEIIGFDACLMATLEVANILKDYANYMVASEEFEVGYGWDYNALISAINDNPTQSGAELGKIIADSFYADTVAKSDAGHDLARVTTLSVIDLSKISALDESINALTAEIEEKIPVDQMPKFSISLDDAERYGIVKGKDSGHMDIKNFAEELDEHLPQFKTLADNVISHVDDAVVYSVRGDSKPNANGISLYMPLTADVVHTTYRYGDVASVNQFYAEYLTQDTLAPAINITQDGSVISGTYEGNDIYEIDILFTTGMDDSGIVKIISSDEFNPHDTEQGFSYSSSHGTIHFEWDETIPSICSKDECVPVYVEWEWHHDTGLAHIPVEIEKIDGTIIEADLQYDVTSVGNEIFIGAYPHSKDGVFEKNMLTLENGDKIHPEIEINHWHTQTHMIVPEDDHSIIVDDAFFTSSFWQTYDGPFYLVVKVCDYARNCSYSDFFEFQVDGDYKFFG